MKKNKLNVRVQSEAPNNIDEGYNRLARLDPRLPQPEQFSKYIQENNFYKSTDVSDFHVAAAYSEIYTKVSNNRHRVMREVDRLRHFYLVDTILGQLSEDALSPEISTGDIIRIESSEKRIQKEIDNLNELIDFDQLIKDITPELISYGEYTLQTDFVGTKYSEKDPEKEASGIVHLRDTVEQGTVIALSQDGKTQGYIEMGGHNKILLHPPRDFVKFTLAGERVKIDLKNQINLEMVRDKKSKELLKILPRYVRVGKSILFPVLAKIKELELLEKLVPATKLSKLSAGTIIGLQVPEAYEMRDAMSAARQVEGLVNSKISIDDDLQEITVQAIMSSAGRLKVIPIFGDKGNLNKLDYKSDEPDDLLGSVKEIRETILDSIGIPTELIFKSDGDSKSELLKRYAKYLRRLKNIQRSIIVGIRDIVHIHLFNKKIQFDPEKIEVSFLNKLVEIDNLDKLEHMDVTVSLLGNLDRYIKDITEEGSAFEGKLNEEVYFGYIDNQLKTIGLQGLLDLKKEPPKDEPEDDEEDDIEIEVEPDDEEDEPQDDEPENDGELQQDEPDEPEPEQ